jgi:two-component system sensor histidine kinase ArlS
MKLYTKLTLYNALSKILIVGVFIVFVPSVIEKMADSHTDAQLRHMKDKTLSIVNRVGVKNFIEEEKDSIFSSYTILKEEFISIEAVTGPAKSGEVIQNTQRSIEDEIVDYRVLSYTFQSGKQYYLLEVGKSLNRVELVQEYLRNLAWYLLVIVLLVTVIGDILFTRFLLNPFMQLELKLKGTSHPEKFDFNTIHSSTTDFRYLDESINEMMHKINNAFVNERLFIANVSHELLTPISIIKNRLENILEEKLPEEAAMRIIETQNTLTRLSKIVNALLLISRIENMQFLKDDEVNLRELVKEVKDEIEDRAQEKNILIHVDIRDEHSIKNANRYLLFIMLVNIVNNAIKYNVLNGHIDISGIISEGHYKLTIKDSGKGIPAELLPALFEPFKKIKKDKRDSHGLGLPIVKTITDFHDIRLQVFSELNKGTTFVLNFPAPGFGSV